MKIQKFKIIYLDYIFSLKENNGVGRWEGGGGGSDFQFEKSDENLPEQVA